MPLGRTTALVLATSLFYFALSAKGYATEATTKSAHADEESAALPPEVAADHGAGVACMERQEYADAVRHFEAAYAKRPDCVWVVRGLALATLRAGDLTRAEQLFTKIASVEPDAFDIQSGLGRIREELGDANGAVEALTEAARLRPDDAENWMSLGRIELKRTRFDAAAKCAEEALRVDRRLRNAHAIRWNAYYLNGDLEGALTAVQQASDSGCNSFSRSMMLAMTEWMLGDRASARRNFQAALDSDDASLYDFLTVIGFDLRGGDFASAKKNIESAIQRFPDDSTASSAHLRCIRGCIKLYEGMSKEALHDFDAATTLDADEGKVQFLCATVLYNNQEYKEAIDCFLAAEDQVVTEATGAFVRSELVKIWLFCPDRSRRDPYRAHRYVHSLLTRQSLQSNPSNIKVCAMAYAADGDFNTAKRLIRQLIGMIDTAPKEPEMSGPSPWSMPRLPSEIHSSSACVRSEVEELLKRFEAEAVLPDYTEIRWPLALGACPVDVTVFTRDEFRRRRH